MNRNNPFVRIQAPEDESGGGGGGIDAIMEDQIDEAAQSEYDQTVQEVQEQSPDQPQNAPANQPVTDPAQQQQQQQPDPNAPITIDPRVLPLLQQPQQQQQPQQEQLTPEQWDEKLKTYYVSNDLAANLIGKLGLEVEDAGAVADLLQEVVNGTVEHVVTLMGHANQLTASQLRQEYQPALDAATAQRDEAFKSSIPATYPTLKGQEQAVEMVIQQLKAQNYQPRTKEEAIQVVAQQTENLIKGFNPQFSLGAPGGAPAQQQQKQTTPQMTTLMAGSGAGGAGGTSGGTNAPKKPAWNSVF